MHAKRRSAVTLLELLVTLMAASVIVIGLGIVYLGAAQDFSNWGHIRETRYSRELLESELLWRMRAIPPEEGVGFRTQAAWAQSRVTFTDETGAQTRTVLTYDYLRNVRGDTLPQLQASLAARDDLWTGVVFQWMSMVYRYEVPLTTLGRSLNSYSSAELTALCGDVGRRAASSILAIGVKQLDFSFVLVSGTAPRQVSASWLLVQL